MTLQFHFAATFLAMTLFLVSCGNLKNPLVPSTSSTTTNSSSSSNSSSSASPILWNKLGSDSEVSNSQVGSNFTRSGAISYPAGVYGNGAMITGTSPYLSFPRTALKTNAGTIEFWFKPNFASAGLATRKTLLDCNAGSAFDRLDTGWDPSGNFYWCIFNTNGVNAIAGPSFVSNDSIHFALVWDSAGIGGTSAKSRIYINGAIWDSTTQTPNQNPASTVVYVGHHTTGSANADGIIDNLKVFDFAKTNFSDRLSE